MPEPKEKSPYMVNSVDRALEVLLLLGKANRELGVTELGKQLGVHKSTVHSLLQTLGHKGFVEQNPLTGKYRLGLKLVELGMLCAGRLEVKTVARPLIEAMCAETGEIVLLAMLNKTDLVIVDRVEPQRPFLMIPKIDFSIAIHCTAVGKALLAFAPEEIVGQVLERGLHRYTPYTVTDRQMLEQELERIRRLDYAIGCNETIQGITCIASPIRDYNGTVVASVSISGSSNVLTPDRYDEFIAKIKTTARLISQRLGYVPHYA